MGKFLRFGQVFGDFLRFDQVFGLRAQIFGDFVRFGQLFGLRAQIFTFFMRIGGFCQVVRAKRSLFVEDFRLLSLLLQEAGSLGLMPVSLWLERSTGRDTDVTLTEALRPAHSATLTGTLTGTQSVTPPATQTLYDEF